MLFVINFVTTVCLTNCSIYLPFILLNSFIDTPTDVSKALFVSELYFIKELQRRMGVCISQVTVFKLNFVSFF